jgi:hypothetical protein
MTAKKRKAMWWVWGGLLAGKAKPQLTGRTVRLFFARNKPWERAPTRRGRPGNPRLLTCARCVGDMWGERKVKVGSPPTRM